MGARVSLIEDNRISNYWQINSRHSWRTLDIDWTALGFGTEVKKRDFGKYLNDMAKKGNSSNEAVQASISENTDRDVPRLAEFGFILVGNLKMHNEVGEKTRIGKAVTAMKEKRRRSHL